MERPGQPVRRRQGLPGRGEVIDATRGCLGNITGQQGVIGVEKQRQQVHEVLLARGQAFADATQPFPVEGGKTVFYGSGFAG